MSAISPIHFRMPAALRQRLRRFAKARNLGEAEALRLVISEHLAEIEDERELAAAERWQLKQALATWERDKRGQLRTVSWEEIEQIFKNALANAPAARRK